MSYDLPWANTSNTPFRKFKQWTHEGGVSTPFVVRWPKGIEPGGMSHQPYHVIDIPATFYDLAGVEYPEEFDGRKITPIEGESFAPVLAGTDRARERPIFFEHVHNRAMREGMWKIVSHRYQPWELYHMEKDRTELVDLAEGEKDRLHRMAKAYDEWAERVGVVNWMEKKG
jgi:arylsulfatase